jgi:type I restriction enzyme M protein
MLKTGGRCAVIVPDGVLFGSSNAHKQIRQELIENHKLDAVISMPSGVFKPYAGVSTAVLFFTKTGTGGTDNVWFYDMTADGYSLDDKRNEVKDNDIPDVLNRYHNLISEKDRARTEKSFLVPCDEIKNNEWDLSINRYKEITYKEIAYAAPSKIISDIETLDKERNQAFVALKEMLK